MTRAPAARERGVYRSAIDELVRTPCIGNRECSLSRRLSVPPCKSGFDCSLRHTMRQPRLMENIRGLATQDSEGGRAAKQVLEEIEMYGQRDASGG